MHIVGIRFPSEIAPRTFTEGALYLWSILHFSRKHLEHSGIKTNF